MRSLFALLLSGPLLALAPVAEAYQEQTVCLDVTKAANTDDERYLAWSAKGTWEINEVTFAPATAVAVDATNVVAFTVGINAGTASTSWTTIASTTTDSDIGGVAFVIGTVRDLTVTKPSTLSRGWQIRVENTNGGTGAAWDGAICITARKV
jgi:hypothetical protein